MAFSPLPAPAGGRGAAGCLRIATDVAAARPDAADRCADDAPDRPASLASSATSVAASDREPIADMPEATTGPSALLLPNRALRRVPAHATRGLPVIIGVINTKPRQSTSTWQPIATGRPGP